MRIFLPVRLTGYKVAAGFKEAVRKLGLFNIQQAGFRFNPARIDIPGSSSNWV